MTISSQNRKAGPFVGNDSTTAFPFEFKVFAASDLQVVRADSSGVETTLVLNTHYTVSLNANQNSNPGGAVTLPAALATGYKLTITSAVAPLQSVDITNQGGMYPAVINAALDKLTILVQQVLDALGRSLKFPISDAAGGNPTLPTKEQRKGRLLAFHDTSGDPVAGPSIADVGTVTANVAAIGTVAENMGAIVAAPGYVTQAKSQADIAAAQAAISAAQASSVLSTAAAITTAQAEANALLGLGIGSSTVDSNGHLVMTYVAPVTSVSINSSGRLTLTY